MSHYAITDSDIEKAKLTVKATILNLAKEIELSEFIQSVVASYTGQLNKRFETAVNKALAEKYGTYEYKFYDESYGDKAGTPSEYDKTINNISAWLSSETYSKKYFKLGLHYKGTEAWYNYDTKKQELAQRNQTLEFYSWGDLDELAKQVTGRIQSLNNEMAKVKDNQKHLDKYAREQRALVEKLNAYNDKISYVLAESYRIK